MKVFLLPLGLPMERRLFSRLGSLRSAASSTNSLSRPERCARSCHARRSGPPTLVAGWRRAVGSDARRERRRARPALESVLSFRRSAAPDQRPDGLQFAVAGLDCRWLGCGQRGDHRFVESLELHPVAIPRAPRKSLPAALSIVGVSMLGNRPRAVRQSQSRSFHRELRRQRSDASGRQRSQHPVRVGLRRRKAYCVFCRRAAMAQTSGGWTLTARIHCS